MNYKIRLAQESDLLTLTEIYNYYIENTAATFYTEPFTVEQRRAWYAGYASTGPYKLLVLEIDGQAAGYASSSPYRRDPAFQQSIETSIYLAPALTGKGYGKPLYQSLFRELREEELHRAYAGIALPNEASVKLHLSLGFREVGIFSEYAMKFGRYWSSMWLEKELSPGSHK